ncbi:MAG: hypothetical protein IPL21_09025 [Saprospirales bacterium]|nr:hypothetical protein [Saprospirales bacterium]
MKKQIKQPIRIILMMLILSLLSISCRKNNPATVDTVKPKFTFLSFWTTYYQNILF